MSKPIRCILLVDDDPDDNFLHRMIIEDSGYCDTVKVAETGHQALQYLVDTSSTNYCSPDVILLDINMPGMNGFEFLEEYEKLDPVYHAKVVLMMLTTSLNPDDEHRAHRHGVVNGYKSKPLTRQMLDDIVKTHFSE
ncbi:response regulator [Rudanella paleaurantiibacter]|uniref:Response regulator n=1 Tax=Rudanella paleaurantiibacter TaxID=2614655 RepID=A0A7J5TZ43_9BACT|nr:response regulator [Rudanella paleaurantiibacter]KAB7730404.1 response regulator [Rudanella paleaurantiibacter]